MGGVGVWRLGVGTGVGLGAGAPSAGSVASRPRLRPTPPPGTHSLLVGASQQGLYEAISARARQLGGRLEPQHISIIAHSFAKQGHA